MKIYKSVYSIDSIANYTNVSISILKHTIEVDETLEKANKIVLLIF